MGIEMMIGKFYNAVPTLHEIEIQRSYYCAIRLYEVGKDRFYKEDYRAALICLTHAENGFIEVLESLPDHIGALEGLSDVYLMQMNLAWKDRDFSTWGKIGLGKKKPIDEILERLKTQAGQNAAR